MQHAFFWIPWILSRSILSLTPPQCNYKSCVILSRILSKLIKSRSVPVSLPSLHSHLLPRQSFTMASPRVIALLLLACFAVHAVSASEFRYLGCLDTAYPIARNAPAPLSAFNRLIFDMTVHFVCP